ncbi:T9SS type A sorting domain-containing protein [Adhaeribacter aquaticus]|uniref:T9SS type A sorting domain-containing protein n=1 Tax=Adhaeribacter aquaticus TaxID=299567 RepID=UPI000406BB03|nr:T9SS type A sorting domain-containing protein [Adhaeribacter aquaticus]
MKQFYSSQILPAASYVIKSFFVFTLLVLFLSPSTASAWCKQENGCYTITYYGYKENISDKTVTLSFQVQVNSKCLSALSNVNFSLPAGAKAISPSNSKTEFEYVVENGTNNPFYGIQFNFDPSKRKGFSSEGLSNGQSDVFYYTLKRDDFNKLSSIQVEAKSALTIGSFKFDYPSGCSGEEEDGSLTALPVTLASFTGANQGQVVELIWVTATEENNSYFQVERSTDGKTFSQIGQVAGKGTTKLQQTYSFTDKVIASATYYYRLRQVDFNGAAEYSKVIAVKTNSSVTGLVKVYPNPASAALQVDLSAFASGSYQVKIASLTGTILSQQAVEAGQVTTLDIQALTSGAYLVLVQGQDLNQTKRFLKN